MTFSFHPEAESEFHEAIEYYEESELGLGYDFSIEVLATIQNIINYSTAWPVIEEDVRRCLVKGCPLCSPRYVRHRNPILSTQNP